jgi:hypothetical protein
MVSSEPPPNSTATSNSSRIAAKFLDVDDIGSLPVAALSASASLSGAS